MVKEYLKEKNVEFEDVNVAADHSAAKEMVEVSGQTGVPVIVIDNEVVIGFDKQKLDELLGKE